MTWSNAKSMLAAVVPPSELRFCLCESAFFERRPGLNRLSCEWYDTFSKALGPWKSASVLLTLQSLPPATCEGEIERWVSSGVPDSDFIERNGITDDCIFEDAERRLRSGWMPRNVSAIGKRLFCIRANRLGIPFDGELASEARLWSSEYENRNPNDPFNGLFDAIPNNEKDMGEFVEMLKGRHAERVKEWKTRNT